MDVHALSNGGKNLQMDEVLIIHWKSFCSYLNCIELLTSVCKFMCSNMTGAEELETTH